MFLNYQIDDFGQFKIEPTVSETEPRYAVLDGLDRFLGDHRYRNYDEAYDQAAKLARQFPGDVFYVVYLDTRVVAERLEPVVRATASF